MPPSPGQIHSLPIKVLYNIDTSPQSYVTVLHDRQEVYFHPQPAASSSSAPDGPMGSCYLKPTVKGICYASPECIPNSSKLDFSVYNLDPSLRSRASPAFSQGHAAQDGSWTGKGFLSWALAEPSQGSSLIRGRLIQHDDFSSANEPGGLGGLEGLMAAASRAGRTDGERAWGLEVQITLKVLNPEGKEAFRGRREFEELLRRGRVTSNTSSPPTESSNSSSVARPEPFRRPVPAPPSGPSGPLRAGGSAPMALPPSQHAPISAPTSSLRPSPVIPKSQLPSSSGPSIAPPSRLSVSSQPPSSVPMANSSSNGPYPSHTPPTHPGSDRPNPLSHTSTLAPPSSSRPTSRSREVTPPPVARPRSPPPSTPSRKKLHDLLRSDGRMSPGLAAQLASNPMLLRLLKAVPPNANALSSLSTSMNEAGDSDKPSPDVETPTPSSAATMRVTNSSEGCSNCGAMESELWRTKKLKDGAVKKVCNACGLYFNEHKRMRPPELWDHQPSDTPRKRNKLDTELPVRSSPRRHRQHGSISQHPLPAAFESPKKRGRGTKTPQPSPRMPTRASSRLEASAGTAAAGLSFTKAMEAPNGLNGVNGNTDSLFFPSMFDSPVDPLTGASNTSGSVPTDSTLQTMDGGQGHDGDVDIEALLAQITNNNDGNFDLQALFGEGSGDGILDMLNSWEGEVKVEESGQRQGARQGTQGHN